MQAHDLMLILGVGVLSVAFRSYHHPLFQKLGAIGVPATSFLAGWLLTGNWVIGLICALLWFFLPWLELLTRVRNLRLPLENQLREQPPPASEVFPNLQEVTEDVEGAGFEFVEDAGWSWDGQRQSFRLFYHPEKHTQAAICLVEQAGIAFYFISISSRLSDGSLWTTWNYPFSYSLMIPPHLHVRRKAGADDLFELMQSHVDFLHDQGIDAAQVDAQQPADLHNNLQRDLHLQIAHNLKVGLLLRTGDGEARYSWRGLVYLWVQFLRDLVRLS